VAKVSLETALRTKGEELALKSQVHEQEVAVMMTKKQNELEAVGGKLEKDYQVKLERAIKELREECGNKIRDNKLEQENLYNKKEDDWKRQVEKVKASLKEKDSELSNLMKKLNEFEKKILVLDGERHNLQQGLRDGEKKWAEDKEKAEKDKKNLEDELGDIRGDRERLIGEYQDLMEVKVNLDNELATYRKLLEGEEERLKMGKIGIVQKIQKEIEKQIVAN